MLLALVLLHQTRGLDMPSSQGSHLMTAIHIKGLQVDDGQKTLLQALDFTIHPGTALTLIGRAVRANPLLAHALMGTLPAP